MNIMYQFMVSEFENFVDAPRNYYDNAEHPVKGDTDEEFGSRTIYEDQELAYARTPDTKKTAHTLKFSGDVTTSSTLVGKISLVNLENKLENLEMDTQYGALRWLYHPDKKWRIRATVSREKIDNDEIYLDFPGWRDGRTGGGQNFDFTRYSAYNRDLTTAQIHTDFEMSKCSTLQFDYRFRSIDREYLEIAQNSSETESVENRFSAAWLMKSDKIRSRISLEYEMTDYPFANKHAMCEPAQANEPALPDNSFYYYFQRERLADASNQPSGSLKLKATVSVFSTPKFSINFQGSYQDDENDELNSYTWERDMLISGVNLFMTPCSKSAISLGYNYLNIESNAVFCVPVMDG